ARAAIPRPAEAGARHRCRRLRSCAQAGTGNHARRARSDGAELQVSVDVSGHAGLESPSQWVVRFLPLIQDGRVLDLACGGGRHARLLASAGHPVLAVDRNADALAAIDARGDNRISTRQVDLEIADDVARPPDWPLKSELYAG